MERNRLISIAVLFLLLGTTLPAFADKGQGEKGGGRGRGRQAQHQHGQQGQRGGPQRQRPAYNRGNNGFHGHGNNGHHYGRIPDDRYRAHFGYRHFFRMGRPRMYNGYHRFLCGGYWFGYNEPWPPGWGYTDDVYVEYIEGGYYLFNRRHPGIHITLNIF